MNYQIKYRLKNTARIRTAIFATEFAANTAKNFIENKPIKIHRGIKTVKSEDGFRPLKTLIVSNKSKRIGTCTTPQETDSPPNMTLESFKQRYN